MAINVELWALVTLPTFLRSVFSKDQKSTDGLHVEEVYT
jgi:hypothetical protein